MDWEKNKRLSFWLRVLQVVDNSVQTQDGLRVRIRLEQQKHVDIRLMSPEVLQKENLQRFTDAFSISRSWADEKDVLAYLWLYSHAT